MAEYGLHRGEASRRGWYGGTYGDRPAWSEPWVAVPVAPKPAPEKPKKTGFWGSVFEVGKGLFELGVYMANSRMPQVSGPVVDGGRVFGWDNRTMLCCYDGLTGAPVWRVGNELPQFVRLHPTPAVAGGLVVVAEADGGNVLRARDAASGDERWSRVLPGTGTSPLLLGGVAYVSDDTGVLSAHRLADGGPLWSLRLADRQPTDPAVDVAAPASDGHVLYAVWEEGVAAVENVSGRVLWHARHGGVGATNAAVFGGFVYAVGTRSPFGQDDDTATGCITAFRADNGRRAWQRDLADWAYAAVAVGSGLVIVGDKRGVVHAFDAANGRPHWTRTLGGSVRHPASIAANTVFVGCTDNGLYALDIGTGNPRWRYEAASAVTGAPAVAQGFVYISDAVGGLYAVDAATGRGPSPADIDG